MKGVNTAHAHRLQRQGLARQSPPAGANVHPDWERPGEGDKNRKDVKRSVGSWMMCICNWLGVYFCLLIFACDNTQLMKMTFHNVAFKHHMKSISPWVTKYQQNYDAAQPFSTLFIIKIVLSHKTVYYMYFWRIMWHRRLEEGLLKNQLCHHRNKLHFKIMIFHSIICITVLTVFLIK